MKNYRSVTFLGCMMQILIFIGYLGLGTWSSHTILSWFNKDIPMIADMIIGLVVGSITIPVAIVGYILQVFGVF